MDLDGTQVTDAGLENLEGATRLRTLSLEFNERITDGGLKHLEGMDQLKQLCLSGTQVTDAGLERLRAMEELEDLWLRNTQVTGAGLDRFTKLRNLFLDGSPVTDAGLVHLQGMRELQELGLEGTQVTDAGLPGLYGLTQLRNLTLSGPKVTDEGVKSSDEYCRPARFSSIAYAANTSPNRKRGWVRSCLRLRFGGSVELRWVREEQICFALPWPLSDIVCANLLFGPLDKGGRKCENCDSQDKARRKVPGAV